MQLAIHFANEITFFGKFLRQLLLFLRHLTDAKTQANGRWRECFENRLATRLQLFLKGQN